METTQNIHSDNNHNIIFEFTPLIYFKIIKKIFTFNILRTYYETSIPLIVFESCPVIVHNRFFIFII